MRILLVEDEQALASVLKRGLDRRVQLLEPVRDLWRRLLAWDLLRRLGCDIAKGYYLSRPVPAAQLQAWLADRPRPSVEDPLPLAA